MRDVGAPRRQVDDPLLVVIRALWGCREPEELRRRTVELLPGLVPACAIAWNKIDLTAGEVQVVMEPDLYSAESVAVFLANLGDHPVIARYRETGDGRSLAISDVLTTRQFRATGLYRHFYRQLAAEDQLSFVIPQPGQLVGVALNRGRPGFSAAEHLLLDVLRPHLIGARRTAGELARLARSLDALDRLLESEGECLVLLDRQLRPEHATAGAQELLARWFPGTAGGTLPAPLRAWLDSLPAGEPSSPALRLERDGQQLLARCLPVAGGLALAFTEPPGQRAERLLRQQGLTAREAQVLRMVAAGTPSARLAQLLRLSVRTVEKHLERVYEKLALENRVGAANLVRELDRRPLGPPAAEPP